MRLTAEEHPEAIKRYGHVRRAGPWRARCNSRLPDAVYLCSRESGHRGPHVAHGRFRLIAVWDGDSSAKPLGRGVAGNRTARDKAPARPKKPIGLRSDPPAGVLATVWKRVSTLISTPEELAFLIFFVTFVGFALYWLLLLMG